MSWLLPVLLFVIWIACVGLLYPEGMWGNAIRLINVVTAALLATNFWEPAATRLEHWKPTWGSSWDFIALWGLFIIFMVIFRTLTDYLSRVKVRFLKIVDQIGSVFFAAWVGWVMVCFTLVTLHTAPLARNFLFDGFQPEQRMLMGLAPDRKWLAFVQKMSNGPFCRWETDEEGKPTTCLFDPHGQFMPNYASRRSMLETGASAAKPEADQQ